MSSTGEAVAPAQLDDLLPGPDVDLDCIMEPFPCLVEGAFEAVQEANEEILDEISENALDAGVLQEQGLSFDAQNEQFIDSYAQGFGIAVAVMIIMVLWTLLRAARDPEHMEDVKKSLFQYLPMGILLCGVGPAIGGVLAGAADALTMEFSSDILLSGMFNVENATGIGTQILAIILMLALIVAAILVLIVLAVQTWALYLGGAVMAIAFMMMIDPSTRQKALKLPALWIGIVFAKPLLFFLLSMVSAVLADKANVADNFLVTGAFMLVGLLLVAFAPLKLMKHAPILPSEGAAGVGTGEAQAAQGFASSQISGGLDKQENKMSAAKNAAAEHGKQTSKDAAKAAATAALVIAASGGTAAPVAGGTALTGTTGKAAAQSVAKEGIKQGGQTAMNSVADKANDAVDNNSGQHSSGGDRGSFGGSLPPGGPGSSPLGPDPSPASASPESGPSDGAPATPAGSGDGAYSPQYKAAMGHVGMMEKHQAAARGPAPKAPSQQKRQAISLANKAVKFASHIGGSN